MNTVNPSHTAGPESAEQTDAGTLFGLPKGAILIITVEFWERFSFYGMLAIFVLFLTSAPSSGGFGWSSKSALALIGLYSGLMYGLPFLGGLLADKVLKKKTAVLIGLGLMTLGHFFLATPAILPGVLLDQNGVDLMHNDTMVLGLLPAPENAVFSGEQFETAYFMVSASFWLAIACLVIGNGLMKSTLAVLLADQFGRNDSRRAVGFTYFYLSISVGALLAGVSIGTIGEMIGWHYGFTIAGLGILVGFIFYICVAGSWLIAPPSDAEVSDKAILQSEDASSSYVQSFAIVAVAGFGMACFMASWFQIFGSWAIFTQEQVNRSILGFEVPVSWFISFNSAVVIAAAPIIAVVLKRMVQAGKDVDYFTKISSALGLALVAHLIMVLASQTGLDWLVLPAIAIALISLGEVIAWVPAYDFVYKAAPSGLQSTVMGAWYLFALGLSGYVSGQIGAWGAENGFTQQSIAIAAMLALIMTFILLVRPYLLRTAGEIGLET